MKVTNMSEKSTNEEILDFFNLPKSTKIYRSYHNEKPTYNDRIWCECFYLNDDKKRFAIRVHQYDEKHNENGPAWICIVNNGVINIRYVVAYFLNGLRHRLNNPALIEYNKNGIITREEYWIQGMMHNSISPALRFSDNGVWNNNFIIKDKFISFDNFFKILERKVNYG
jgi:hypothetical protein